MGSFWGLNDAGKEAGRWPREMGAWSSQQMRDWLQRSNNYGDLGDFYNTGAADYWTQRRNEGFANPQNLTARGQEISPWVQDYLRNQGTRRQTITDREGGRRTAEDVSGEMSGRLDEMGRNIGENFTGIEGEINDTATRDSQRENDASTDVTNNIKNSSSSMRGAINDTFGGLRAGNASTYGGIRSAAKDSFATRVKNLGLLAPGGDAQTARVGRSFAPQVADTLQRLRRAGVDPNSPEAQSVLRSVETSRSRAMDDSSADATRGFVDASNRLESDRLGFMTDAEREQFNNEADLATGQTDRSNRVTGSEADAYNQERRTSARNLSNIDNSRSDRTVQNLDTSFGRGQQLLTDRNNLSGWTRTAGMQDVDRANANTEGDDAAEIAGGRLQDGQFDRGVAWTGMDQSTRDNAVSNLGRIGSQYYNNMFQSSSQAQGWGNQANNAYQTAYEREAPKAGWGSRLLGGIASAALPLIFPGSGMGSQAGRAIGGAAIGGLTGSTAAPNGGGWGGNTRGGGGGGGQFGGGWGGSQNPYTFSVLNPSDYRMPAAPQLGGGVRSGQYGGGTTSRNRWAA